jgi:hypothetical protein
MAASLSAALLGTSAIPPHWLHSIREETHTPQAIQTLADCLFDKFPTAGYPALT